MASTGGVEGKLHVGIFTPAFSYPLSMSLAATMKAALSDLGLHEDECEFLKEDKNKLACVIKKNDVFTLQYVEELYEHNKALLVQLERAAEGLVVFQNQVCKDADLIRELKEQLSSSNAAWELKYEEEHALRMVLQGRLDQLKLVVNSDISDTPEPSRPKIPKLQLNVMNGKESTEKIPPLVISELRNGVTSPRNSPTRDTVMEAPRFVHSSPRETVHSPSPVPQPITNVNGKRSISSSNLNGEAVPHANGKHPDASPRTTLSPRGPQTSPRAASSPSPRSHAPAQSPSPRSIHTLAQSPIPGHVQNVKEHFRRHSANLGGVYEESTAAMRRHTNAADILGRTPSSPQARASEIAPHYFDLTQPDVHSLPVMQSFSYGTDPLKRKSVIVHVKSRSEAQIDVPADTLSQNKNGGRKKIERTPSLLTFSIKKRGENERNRSSMRISSSSSSDMENANLDASCRLCNCAKFRVTNVEWMCSCGHANIKHAVFLKASPAPSPTVSPRKIG